MPQEVVEHRPMEQDARVEVSQGHDEVEAFEDGYLLVFHWRRKARLQRKFGGQLLLPFKEVGL